MPDRGVLPTVGLSLGTEYRERLSALARRVLHGADVVRDGLFSARYPEPVSASERSALVSVSQINPNIPLTVNLIKLLITRGILGFCRFHYPHRFPTLSSLSLVKMFRIIE